MNRKSVLHLNMFLCFLGACFGFFGMGRWFGEDALTTVQAFKKFWVYWVLCFVLPAIGQAIVKTHDEMKK